MHKHYYEKCKTEYPTSPEIEFDEYLHGIHVSRLSEDALIQLLKSYDDNLSLQIPAGNSPSSRIWNTPPHCSSPDRDLEKSLEKASQEITKKISELMGCFTKVQEMKLIIHHKQHEDTKFRGAQYAWHWDNHPDELFNVMLYLSDVEGEDDGAYQYMADTSGKGIINKGFDHNLTEEFAQQLGIVKSVTGKAGDFFLFNNNNIHRAGVPTVKDRKVVLYHIRPCMKPVSKQLDWNYLNQHFETLLRWDLKA